MPKIHSLPTSLEGAAVVRILSTLIEFGELVSRIHPFHADGKVLVTPEVAA